MSESSSTNLQTTVSQEISWVGTGLHTGEKSQVIIKPAGSNHGIKIHRTDIEDARVINADVKMVNSTLRSTDLKAGNSSARTVEHLLAALYAARVDNAVIELTGSEIPILDGSVAPFFERIASHKQEIENTTSKSWGYHKVIEFTCDDSGASYMFLPSTKFSVEVVLVPGDVEVVGDSYASYEEGKDFSEFSRARTFVHTKELVGLVKKGLIKGGDLENALVIPSGETGEQELRETLSALGRDDIQKTVEKVKKGFSLRTPNEPAQHKLVDLIGDLSLVGCRIKGKIIAKKPGHTGNVAFAKHLKSLYQKDVKLRGLPLYDPEKEPLHDIEAIKGILPHRYPFLLVDKVIELSDTYVVGVKNITFNESLFQGHFPGNSVFPGVLQMEALAQTGGILALHNVEEPSNWDTYFLKMDNVKFKRKVLPGDSLILKMELLSPIRRGIVHMQGTAYVGNAIVSEGELTAQIVDRTKL